MKRILLSSLCLAALACGDDPAGVDARQCTGACAGLAITIDSVRLVLPPGQTTVYSGDTVTAHVFVTNTGTVAADTLTQIELGDWSNAYGSLHIGGLAPGEDRRFDVRVAFGRFSPFARSRDSLFVEVFREGNAVPHGYQFLTETISPSFSYSPTTLRFADVPAVLFVPGEDTVHLVVTNPGPRPIASDSLSICIYDLDYCPAVAEVPPALPAIAAGETRTIGIPVRFVRDPYDAFMFDAWNYELRICYHPVNDLACAFQEVEFRADFERFCAVRRLALGQTIEATARGRGCGVGTLTDHTDISSFEAVSGRTYETTVMADQSAAVIFRDSAARAVATVTLAGGRTRISPTFSGRIYIIVNTTAASYSLRVSEVSE